MDGPQTGGRRLAVLGLRGAVTQRLPSPRRHRRPQTPGGAHAGAQAPRGGQLATSRTAARRPTCPDPGAPGPASPAPSPPWPRRPRALPRSQAGSLPRGTAADRRAARTSQGVSRRTFVARSRGWCLGRGSRAQKLGPDGARRPPRWEAGAPGRPGGVRCRPRPAVWRFLSLFDLE